MHRLRAPDAAYLLRVLPLEPGLQAKLRAFGAGTGSLSDEDCETLRELVGDRLAAVGFGPDSEPTPEGLRLEELIDQLFTG